VNVVLIGPPGVGKGTQAAGLSRRFEMVHIATGNILRAAVHDQSAFGKQVAKVLTSGQLVSDDLMVDLIRKRLAEDDAQQGWLMDGFPRTVAQAEALTGLLDDLDQTIHAVIRMSVPDDVIVARLAGRLSCHTCNATTSREQVPEGEGGPCPTCGARDLFVRDDDREETIRERLAVFQAQTDPAVALLGRQYPLREVSGVGTPQEVAERLNGVLG